MFDSFTVEVRCCLELESGLEESVCGKGTCGKYVLWAGQHKYAFSYILFHLTLTVLLW